MASSGFKIKVGLDSTAAERGLANIGRHANKLNRSMGRLAGKGLKLATGIGAATAAMAVFAGIKFIKDSSKAAADFEMMAGSFETLLGSSAKAAERIEKLMAFSVKTPFEPKELIMASKTLETMAGETLSIGEGLAMVGDAAIGATQPLEIIAGHVGRMFMAMTTGQSFMEPLRELQKFSGVSKTGFLALKKLNDEMVKSKVPMDMASAYREIKEAMKQWEGEMEKASRRHGGMVSTMLGNLDILRVGFGEGINRGLNAGVEKMNETLPKFKEAAQALGDAIGLGIGNAFQGDMKLLELQVSFAFAKLAEIGAGVFLKLLSAMLAHGMTQIIPKLLGQDRETLRGYGVTDEQLDKGNVMGEGWLAKKIQERAGDYDLPAALKSTAGLAGSPEILEKINAELIRLREIAEKQPKEAKEVVEKVQITSTIFGGVEYHHAPAGLPTPEGF